jgi:hypothetical protein
MAHENTQLIHTETYGEVSSRKDRPGRPRKLTAPELIDEALRRNGAHPHVKNPMEPNTLFLASDDLSGILPLVQALKAQDSAANGRCVRKDAQSILAGIASYPVPMAELRQPTRSAARKREKHDRWVELNLAWLHRRYGAHLYAVLEHRDEKHPHVHWYCPGFLENGRFTMGSLHAGQHAGKKAVADAIAANGGPLDPALRKFTYNEAYKAAMVAEADDYYEHVSKPLGMLRIGSAPRPRVPRPVHLANEKAKIAEEEAVKARKEADELRAELARVNSLLAARQRLQFDPKQGPATVAQP